MKEKLKFSKQFNKLRFFLGDIRDKSRLMLAFNKVDIVIHAAALKQVPAAEYNPVEFIKTNVIGTQNVVECAIDSSVDKLVSLSTDKASSPINLYGATKLCADKLVISSNNLKGTKKISLSVVRYGNVINSRGSIVPLLLSQKNEKIFTITDTSMTRFSITLDQGIETVIWAIKNCKGGEIVVPKIPSYDLKTLIRAIDKNVKVKIIGIRKGEKIHEEMINPADSNLTVELKKYFIIAPDISLKKKLLKNSKGNLLKIIFTINLT